MLLNLNVSKAVGYDAIPAQLLCDDPYIIDQLVTSIFNEIVCKNTFHECMKYEEVSPLFKKDDPLTKNNYRPLI